MENRPSWCAMTVIAPPTYSSRGAFRSRKSSRLRNTPVDVGVADIQQRKRRSIAAGAGAYMTRIRYVNQCAACHTLQYDKLIAQPAPHDQPQVVHAFIMNKYRDYIQAHPEALRSPAQEISAGEDLLFAPEALRPTRTEPGQIANSACRMGAAPHPGSGRAAVEQELQAVPRLDRTRRRGSASVGQGHHSAPMASAFGI